MPKKLACLMILILGMILMMGIVYFAVPLNVAASSITPVLNPTKTFTNISVDGLLDVRRELLTVWRYTRGEKARKHIRIALNKLEWYLRAVPVSTLPKPFGNRPYHRSEDVCPENRTSVPRHAKNIIDKAFKPVNCSNGEPLYSLVTVALNYASVGPNNTDSLIKAIKGIRTYNRDLNVVVAIPNGRIPSQLSALAPGIHFTQIPKVEIDNVGKAWNTLIAKTKTPYILIGRALEWFTDDVKLERLIREVTELGVAVVAGSTRTLADGHWTVGCHQTDLVNYTLKYEAGYYESAHECLFCDYVTGPFVARTATLAELRFDEVSFKAKNSEGLFEDLFFRLQDIGGETVVCPDSMLFQRKVETSRSKADWQSFAKKWKLSRLFTVSGHDFSYSCEAISTACVPQKGLALAPCCLQDLAEGLKFLARFCAENNMACEATGGTVLGSAKFDGVLPWERDGDMRLVSANFTSAKNLQEKITSAGYKVSFSDERSNCDVKGGSAVLTTPNGWKLDFWAVCTPTLESLEFLEKGMETTKISIDGHWINACRSPGSYNRDYYAEGAYTHVEHYSTFGGDGRSRYNPGYFAPCPAKTRVERSGCLNQYFPDGVLQFR